MFNRSPRCSAAREAFRSAMRGPMGIGLQNTRAGYNYRIWVTTWVLPNIVVANPKHFEGVELPTWVTGSMYKVKA